MLTPWRLERGQAKELLQMYVGEVAVAAGVCGAGPEGAPGPRTVTLCCVVQHLDLSSQSRPDSEAFDLTVIQAPVDGPA